MDNEQFKKLTTAADFFEAAARKVLATDGKLHAETLISSVSRMAGSLMYRSFGFDQDIAPGTSVLSEHANKFGPTLMEIMLLTLRQLGHDVCQDNLNTDYATAKVSQLTFKESHERLASAYLLYREASQMSFHDAALGAAIASGILVHKCREVLAVEKGGAVAVYGFVEGTKTAPYPLASTQGTKDERQSEKHKKPWYKIW